MKILYIGNYRDSTSFGRLCRDYIKALITAGHDVVCRPYMHVQGQKVKLSPDIESAEDKSSEGAKVCIQQVPIEDAIVDHRFDKNVFILTTLRNWKQSDRESLNKFRDCVVFAMNDYTYNLFSPITTSNNIVLQRIPYPSHLVADLLQQPTEKPKELTNDTFKFYFMGKMSGRKNLAKILHAFHLEFNKDEPVDFVIKTTTDIDPSQAKAVIQQTIGSLKTELGKTDGYKEEIIITDFFEDENLTSIHQACDCLVSVSSAECQDYLAKHARMAGNSVIVPMNHMEKEDIMYCNMVLQLPMYLDYSGFVPKINLTTYPSNKTDIVQDFSVLQLQDLMRRAYTQSKVFSKTPKSYPNVFEKVVNSVL